MKYLLNIISILLDIGLIIFYFRVLLCLFNSIRYELRNETSVSQHTAYLVSSIFLAIVHLLIPLFSVKFVSTSFGLGIIYSSKNFWSVIFNTTQNLSILFLTIYMIKKIFVGTNFDRRINFLIICFTIVAVISFVLFLNTYTETEKFIASTYTRYYALNTLALSQSYIHLFFLLNVLLITSLSIFILHERLKENAKISNIYALYTLIFIILYMIANTTFMSVSTFDVSQKNTILMCNIFYINQEIVQGFIPAFIIYFIRYRKINIIKERLTIKYGKEFTR